MDETNLLPPTIAGVELPLACEWGAIPLAERAIHGQRSTLLFGERVREVQVDEQSIAFCLTAEDYALVTAFVENERRCCALMTFSITLQPDMGPIWLRVYGDASVRIAMLQMVGGAALSATEQALAVQVVP